MQLIGHLLFLFNDAARVAEFKPVGKIAVRMFAAGCQLPNGK